MKVLIAVAGNEGEAFFRRLLALGCVQAADAVLLAHVVAVEPRAGVEDGRERFMVRRSLGQSRRGEISLAEEERANTVLQTALRHLLAGGRSEDSIRRIVLRGKRNEALQQLTHDESCDLIVVGGRPGKPGPHSLGKTARFLIDHAPEAALLVRSQ